MDTPGNDEPSTDADDEAAASSPHPPADTEPIEVGDPTGGATTSASITPPSAPPTPPPAPPAPGAGPAASDEPSGGLGGDWPAQATDAIVNVVGAVRDKTTGPITTIARGAVFGLFAAILGVVVAVLLIVMAIRLLDEALPSGVWVAYLILGVLFLIGGAIVFRKRNQPASASGNTGRA